VLYSQSITFPATTADHIGRLLARGECYEADLLRDMRRRVGRRVAVDVGAHLGGHTVWLAGVCGLHVVAIEPNPTLAAMLRANVDANHLQRHVRVLQVAAGATAARGHLLPDDTNSGMGRVALDPQGSVEVVTLDSLELADVALVKIDVEGSEMEVLAGAQETIDRWHPLLYVESLDPESLTCWMQERGYEMFGRYATTPVYGFAHR
jgi:FkbM family methyltransferase